MGMISGSVCGALRVQGWWAPVRRRIKEFRYPAEIISHCVWLYYRFPLSLREVQEMMLARGVTVSHEAIVRHEVLGNRVGVEDLRRWVVAAVR